MNFYRSKKLFSYTTIVLFTLLFKGKVADRKFYKFYCTDDFNAISTFINNEAEIVSKKIFIEYCLIIFFTLRFEFCFNL